MQSGKSDTVSGSTAPIAQPLLLVGAVVGAIAASLVAIGVIIGLWKVGLMVAYDQRLLARAAAVADQSLSQVKELAVRLEAVEAALSKLTIATGNNFGTEATKNAGAEISIQIGDEWKIVGTGDFNGDGKTDLLLRHANGNTNVFLMDGATVLGGSNTSLQVGNDWQVRAIGDFNGDGKSDILWQNADGRTSIWLMNGPTVLDTPSSGSK
jgi:VCBS repeat protein